MSRNVHLPRSIDMPWNQHMPGFRELRGPGDVCTESNLRGRRTVVLWRCHLHGRPHLSRHCDLFDCQLQRAPHLCGNDDLPGCQLRGNRDLPVGDLLWLADLQDHTVMPRLRHLRRDSHVRQYADLSRYADFAWVSDLPRHHDLCRRNECDV